MRSLTRTATILGGEAELVTIESTTTSGFAGLQIIGNISDICRDGKERAKTVLENLGFKLGHKRILINFSPADSRKEGNHFDLPIAISLAMLTNKIESEVDPNDWLFAAELGLDGRLRPARAVVPLALTAMRSGLKGVVLAKENLAEMQALSEVARYHEQDFRYLGFDTLAEVLAFVFEGQMPDNADLIGSGGEAADLPLCDFDDMVLDPELRKAALCFAVGRHSLLLRGSPGTGKSMFASRLPSLLPKLDSHTHIDALRIHSLLGERLPLSILKGRAPFRRPHHSTNPHAILGTGDRPGEISLAHGGVLFLDELPEFRRDLLESLREPLETHEVQVARAQSKACWKAKAQLVAACNNCPCGYNGSKKQLCRCSSQKVLAYAQRLSGPLLERIDIHCQMPELKAGDLSSLPSGQSQSLLDEIARARDFMHERWQRPLANSEASLEDILQSSAGELGDKRELLAQIEAKPISTRSSLRALRVARTLADLERSRKINESHLGMALRWRENRYI